MLNFADDALMELPVKSSNGCQRKWYNYPTDEYIKEQATLNGYPIPDHKVEALVYKIAQQILPEDTIVPYKLCKVDHEGKVVEACCSPNFLKEGEQLTSLYSIMDTNNITYTVTMSLEQKYLQILSAYRLHGLRAEQYLADTFLLDYIIWNADRHMRNLSIIYNQVTHEYRLPPIFDNGRSMLITRPDILDKPGLKGCKSVKCLPYGHNYYTVLEFMRSQGYLRDLSGRTINLFREEYPNEKAFILSVRNLAVLDASASDVYAEDIVRWKSIYL